MLNDFLEHLLNKVYQNCRLMGLLPPPLPAASSYIKLGGWEISYNWKGRTRLAYELMGDIRVFTKTIHFNYKYALQLNNANSDERFSFDSFVLTMAHEIAHCLLTDYDPIQGREHNSLHQNTTELLEKYLWTLPEIQELSALQDGKKINFLH
jgi:predicted metallopeptidase